MDGEQLAKIHDLAKSGVAQGAKLGVGGQPKQGEKGFFFEPTVFSDVTEDMRIAKEEVGMTCYNVVL